MPITETLDSYLSELIRARSIQPEGELPRDVQDSIITTLCQAVTQCQARDVSSARDGLEALDGDVCSNLDQ